MYLYNEKGTLSIQNMFPSIIPAEFKYKIPIVKVNPVEKDVKNNQISETPAIIETKCSENSEELTNERIPNNKHFPLYYGWV